MWILPKNFPTSLCATATAGSTSASTEFSETDYNSPLLARSKPLPWKTLSQKWKQDSLLRLRSGLTFAHSLGKTSWASAWFREVFHVNHLARQANEEQTSTPATSSHTSSMESSDADLPLFSWKMSKESSAPSSPGTDGATPPERPFCSMSSANWKEWVTARRLEFSARARSAHRTRGSVSSFWPTMTNNEAHNTACPSQFKRNSLPLTARVITENHASFAATNSTTNCSENTAAQTAKEMDAWQTPTTNMDIVRSEEGVQKRIAFRASIGRKSIPDGNLGEQMQRVQKEAANWPTPAAQDGKQAGITPFQAKEGNHTNLLHIAAIKSTYGQAAPVNPSTDGSRQGLWATPRSAMASMHPEYGEHWNDKRGGESIATQVWKEQQWGTPTTRDHKSGRGNEDREYKELTPMVERTQTGKLNPRWVETLQGVCMGWTSPSCPASVTKNWLKFTSGWCAAITAQTNSGFLGTE